MYHNTLYYIIKKTVKTKNISFFTVPKKYLIQKCLLHF